MNLDRLMKMGYGKCILCKDETNNGLLCRDCWEIQRRKNYEFDIYTKSEKSLLEYYDEIIEAINKQSDYEMIRIGLYILSAIAYELAKKQNNLKKVDRLEKDIKKIEKNTNKIIKRNLEEVNKDAKNNENKQRTDPRMRNEKQPYYRCEDGHWVKSKAEQIIDNWLFNKQIIHSYEKRIPDFDTTKFCDFYLPKYDVYIEYWGKEENNNYYSKNKEEKIEIYNRLKLKRLDLEKKEEEILIDTLEEKLYKIIKNKF